MGLLLFGLVFGSVACFIFAVQPDTIAIAIRQRLYEEIIHKKPKSALAKAFEAMARLNERLPVGGYLRELVPQLEQGHVPLDAAQFFAVQELSAIGIGGLLSTFIGIKNPAWLVLFLAIGFFVPVLWLRNRNTQRRQSIARDLPDVVDLLSLCMEAGGDFISAMGRVVESYRRCPLIEELGSVLQEIRVGKRRRDALLALAHRVRTPEVSSFTRTLVQADRMGTGMAEALNILSEDMRLRRFHWAERFAQQAPLKMLIPLLLSLASALIIVAGPILLKFLRGDLMLPSAGAPTTQPRGFGAPQTLQVPPIIRRP